VIRSKTQTGLRALAAAVMLIAGGASAHAATVWNAGSDFSLVSNPNGDWSYGVESTLGGAFSGLMFADSAHGLEAWASNANYPGEDATAYIAHNPTASTITWTTFSVPPNALQLHPGLTGQYAVVRWTSPFLVNTSITVNGSFFSEDNHLTPTPAGTTSDAHILRDGVSLLDTNIDGTGVASPFDLTFVVGAGSTVDFAVGFGSNMDYHFDSTGLEAQIAANPEPGTWILLMSGLIVGVAARRRRLWHRDA
jgi:hypothetical protein